MTDSNEKVSYAKYSDFNLFSYKSIAYMMDKNEEIWKLLKYLTPDAWNKPNLTKEEKAALIYEGSEDGTGFRVFLDDGLPDVQIREDCIIRISPFSLKAYNRTYGTIYIRVEIYAHWKINHLSNYTTRVDTISKEVLGLFNGATIGGIGKLHFDAAQSAATQSRMETSGQIPFKGKVFFFGNKIA